MIKGRDKNDIFHSGDVIVSKIDTKEQIVVPVPHFREEILDTHQEHFYECFVDEAQETMIPRGRLIL